jgi:hypothetical protein
MKFWRNAAALSTVFHPETTHAGVTPPLEMSKMKVDPTMCMKTKDGWTKCLNIIGHLCLVGALFAGNRAKFVLNSTKVPRIYKTTTGAESLVLTGHLGRPKSNPLNCSGALPPVGGTGPPLTGSPLGIR